VLVQRAEFRVVFLGTGKLTGNFAQSLPKPQNSAQKTQITFRNRELTGNFQFSSQVVQRQGDTQEGGPDST
jgi:hypothetical protein